MENTIRKSLECPVCWEIPTGKIYQCTNGHLVCEVCSVQCFFCPQCKLTFAIKNNKSRCVTLENIRDELEEDCQNHKRGCQEKVKRKEVAAHLNVCNFRPPNLCKMLGFETCQFDGNPLIWLHLLDVHKLTNIVGDSELDLFYTRACFEGGHQFQREQGYHVIPGVSLMTQLEDPKGSFLICLAIDNDNQYCSWVSLSLNTGIPAEDASKYQVQYSLSNTEDDYKNFEYKWTTPLFSFKELDTVLKNPPHPISTAFLKNVPGDKRNSTLDNKKLFLRFRIKRVTQRIDFVI